jgi:hypothetical protein
MADRYWVGGTDNWDSTAGTKWATTSGGAGGAAVPTSSDNVYLDANSGSGTVTINTAGRTCLDLICTGFTGTLAINQTISIYGSLTLASGMTLTGTVTITGVTFAATSSGKTITCAGKTIPGSTTINGIGGEWILQDAWVSDSARNFNIAGGTFDANNQNVTCGRLSSSNSNTRTIKMGSGTWTLNITGSATVWDMTTTTNLTLNCNTSTIKLTGARTGNQTFISGSQTFYNFEDNSSGAFVLTTTGSPTFNSFKMSAGRTVKITAGTTLTSTTFDLNGTAGNLITITSDTASAHTIAKAGGGTVVADYCDISYSTASPAATFSATNSTDSGNNTNWSFGAAVRNLFFGSNF